MKTITTSRIYQFSQISIQLCIIGLLMTLSSCSRYFYSPDDNNMQSIHEKGDVHLSASSSIGGLGVSTNRKKHYNFQIGASPIKHLSVAGSFFYIRDSLISDNGFNTSFDDDSGSGEGHIWNGAIGTYYFFSDADKPIYKKEGYQYYRGENEMLGGHYFDFYLGHSSGVSRNYYNGWRVTDVTTLRFNKTYGQIGWHWKSEMMGFSYTFKVSRLNFYSAKSFGRIASDVLSRINQLENQSKFYTRESSLRVHYGIKQARVFFNWTYLNAPQRLKDFGVDNNNFQLGVFIEIDEILRKDDKYVPDY